MAILNLYAGEDTLVPTASGLGFFGSIGFDASLAIGTYNGRTFVTNAIGTIQGFEANNNKYKSSTEVTHGQSGSGITLTRLPNELVTANIRFTHGLSIFTQNVKIYIFDGTFDGTLANKLVPAENLIFQIAEIRHRDNLQTTVSPYSDPSWTNVSASGSNWITLVSSPGIKGQREGGFEVLSTRHDWYVTMSCTPTQLGNKQFGVTVDLEYL